MEKVIYKYFVVAASQDDDGTPIFFNGVITKEKPVEDEEDIMLLERALASHYQRPATLLTYQYMGSREVVGK